MESADQAGKAILLKIKASLNETNIVGTQREFYFYLYGNESYWAKDTIKNLIYLISNTFKEFKTSKFGNRILG